MIRPTGFTPTSAPMAATGFKSAVTGPQDRLELQGIEPGRASVEVAPAQTAEQAALSALPGLASLPLAERMQRLPVEYLIKRRFRLWFMDEHKPVTAEKAAGILGQSPRLRVRASAEETPQPLTSSQDFVKLEALQGQGDVSQLDRPDLARQLKQLSAQKGITFSVDGFPVEAYGAYNQLTQGESSVMLRCHQVPVSLLGKEPLDLDQLQEAIDKVGPMLKDPLAVAEHVEKFGDRDGELARLEKGADGPTYAALRGALRHSSMKDLKAGLNLVQQGTLHERLELLQATNYHQQRWMRDYRQMGQTYDKLRESGVRPEDARSYCGQLSQLRQFENAVERLGQLCPATPDQLALYVRLVQGEHHPQNALTAARVLAAPAGQLSESERISLFEKLPGSLAHRASAWSLLQADLAQGKTVAEATRRAQTLIRAMDTQADAGPAGAYAGQHPERLAGVSRLLESRVPAGDVGPLLDQIYAFKDNHAERVEVAAALADSAAEKAPPFLEAMQKQLEAGHTGPEVSKDLAPLAAACKALTLETVQGIAQDYRVDPKRTQVTTRLVDLGLKEQTLPILHGMEAWSCQSPLEERLQAMVEAGAGRKDYNNLADLPGGRQHACDAFAALVGAGNSLEAARKRVGASIAALGYNVREQGLACMRVLKEHAANPGALDVFQEVHGSCQNVGWARECTELLLENAGSSTQSQRIAAAQKLGLSRLPDQSSRTALIRCVRNELAAGGQLDELTALVAQATREDPWVSLGHVAQHREDTARMTSLLQAGFNPEVAASTLERSRGGSLDELLPLGKGGRSIRQEHLGPLQEIQNPDPPTLKRLCVALGNRAVETGPLAELYPKSLQGKPEATEAVARLIEESRLKGGDLVRVFQALEPAAGRTTLTERLNAFKDAGGLNNDYYAPGSSLKMCLELAAALRCQLQAGVPLESAKTGLIELWNALKVGYRGPSEGAAAFRYVAELGGATERRDCFTKLLGTRITADQAAAAEKRIYPPAGKTLYATRAQAFLDLGLAGADEADRQSKFGAYRAELNQGHDHAQTMERLRKLQGAVDNWPNEEHRAAFDYVADQHPSPREMAALMDQLAAGVKPSVAVGSLRRVGGDLERLQSLKGLGQAGHTLEDSVAAAFQKQQEEAVARGLSRVTVAGTMDRLTRAVGSARLATPDRIQAAEYWGQSLADRIEGSEIFARLLENGLTVENAIGMLELMDQPAGNTTLTQRYDATRDLGGLSTDFYGPGRRLDQMRTFYAAVEQPLRHGVPLEQVKTEVGAIWSSTREYHRLELLPLLGQYAEVSGSPEERALILELLKQNWTHEEVRLVSSELHKPLGRSNFGDRKHAFEALGLTAEHSTELKEQAFATLRADVEAGRTLREAVDGSKPLIAGLHDSKARRSLKIHSRELLGQPAQRAAFRKLVLAGVSPEIAIGTVTSASKANLVAHAELVSHLAPITTLAAPHAQAFTKALDEHQKPLELARLAEVVAARHYHNPTGPLEYFCQNLTAGGPAFDVFLNLLEEAPREARSLHQSLLGLPDKAYELYGVFRGAGVSAPDAAGLLAKMKENLGGTSFEQRAEAYERMAQVSSVDGRGWGRRAWNSILDGSDVTTGQLPVLATIYSKLVDLGQTSQRACDLVCQIYQTEQAKGIGSEALAARLEEISEVAKLDIRPDTGVAVLRDDADRVVFSGVTVKKRKAPTQ